MNCEKVCCFIADWLKGYAGESNQEGFVVGISGGIDSAVTSVLCAMTGMKVVALEMPIRQHRPEKERSAIHLEWLRSRYPNVKTQQVDLTPVLASCEAAFPSDIQDALVMANTRARLRMTTLYAFASRYKLLVAGTGNKVEDFGVGFFTKYGDGGVDISPIADLFKSEVYELASFMNIAEEIRKAKPTDGLYADERSDEDQIGASYDELEWAMKHEENARGGELSQRQKHVLEIFRSRHRANLHKMVPIPVCMVPEKIKTS